VVGKELLAIRTLFTKLLPEQLATTLPLHICSHALPSSLSLSLSLSLLLCLSLQIGCPVQYYVGDKIFVVVSNEADANLVGRYTAMLIKHRDLSLSLSQFACTDTL